MSSEKAASTETTLIPTSLDLFIDGITNPLNAEGINDKIYSEQKHDWQKSEAAAILNFLFSPKTRENIRIYIKRSSADPFKPNQILDGNPYISSFVFRLATDEHSLYNKTYYTGMLEKMSVFLVETNLFIIVAHLVLLYIDQIIDWNKLRGNFVVINGFLRFGYDTNDKQVIYDVNMNNFRNLIKSNGLKINLGLCDSHKTIYSKEYNTHLRKSDFEKILDSKGYTSVSLGDTFKQKISELLDLFGLLKTGALDG